MSTIGKQFGNLASLEVSDDAASTWSELTNATTLNFAISAGTVSFADFATSGWDDLREGLKTATITADGNINIADTPDAAQTKLFNYTLAGIATGDPAVTKADYRFRWRFQTGTGEDEFVGEGTVTDNTSSMPNQAPGTFSYTINVSGSTIVKSTQA